MSDRSDHRVDERIRDRTGSGSGARRGGNRVGGARGPAAADRRLARGGDHADRPERAPGLQRLRDAGSHVRVTAGGRPLRRARSRRAAAERRRRQRRAGLRRACRLRGRYRDRLLRAARLRRDPRRRRRPGRAARHLRLALHARLLWRRVSRSRGSWRCVRGRLERARSERGAQLRQPLRDGRARALPSRPVLVLPAGRRPCDPRLGARGLGGGDRASGLSRARRPRELVAASSLVRPAAAERHRAELRVAASLAVPRRAGASRPPRVPRPPRGPASQRRRCGARRDVHACHRATLRTGVRALRLLGHRRVRGADHPAAAPRRGGPGRRQRRAARDSRPAALAHHPLRQAHASRTAAAWSSSSTSSRASTPATPL